MTMTKMISIMKHRRKIEEYIRLFLSHHELSREIHFDLEILNM